MKILDKVQINALKAMEKKKEVDEGMKLAQTVDKLRETKSKEEENLRKFRDESIKAVKIDIEALLEQKNVLQGQIDTLNKEKIKAQAPIELSNEWKKVEQTKKDVYNLKQELFDRETHLITREALVQKLDERELEISRKEKESETYLDEIRINYEKTEDMRRMVEGSKLQHENAIAERVYNLDVKEQKLVERENELLVQTANVSNEKKDLLSRDSYLTERESRLELRNQELFDREEKVKEMEALTKRYNLEASTNYDVSENLKVEIEKNKENSDKDIKERYTELAEREKAFGYKERDFINKKEQLEADNKDIEKEKLHISSQQETLRQAWVNIKKLNK